jgi:hypothetical protein
LDNNSIIADKLGFAFTARQHSKRLALALINI